MEDNHWKRKAAEWLFFLFLSLTVVSGSLVLVNFVKAFQTEQLWKEIREARDNKRLASDDKWISGDILPEYQELYERNPDIVGWLTISRARIDSPIMHTKDDPEHYLRRNFDGKEDSGGTPFIDYRCSISPRRSFNLILYGHYTNRDGLFRRLLDYAYRYWGTENDEICFDTLTEKGVYELAAAFFYDSTGAVLNNPNSNTGEEAYTFYNYIELDSEEGFERFLKGINELKLYETGVEITPEDQLLTIICCAPEEFSGIKEGGRFVVIAKKVSR